MIFDKQSLLSDKQAITADTVSTNVIDTGANGTVYGASGPLGRDNGKGTKIPLLIQVVEDFNTLTSLEIKVVVDDNAAMSSPKTVATTGVILLADLKAGKQFSIDTIPLGTDDRYIALSYDVTGTAPTTGRISAGVTLGNQTN
jgi:hypothetical protein